MDAGRSTYDKGYYTFEWAVPLDSGDPNDLRAKPGDEFRFNIAFFDRFRVDLKDTQVGGLFGSDLNKATAWGTLRLADKVKDDGGTAFRGPAWLDAAFGKPDKPPANRLRMLAVSLLTGQSVPIGKAEVAYSYLNPDGKETPGKAKLYLPATVQKGGKLPLLYSAGYELDDVSAAGWVERGYAVATPASLDGVPLARTANPDIALLHIVRALPFVDDTRVVVTGTSAGGWTAFLLAAETFPLAGVAPAVAPMNWGYNAAYLLKQKDRLTPKVPALFTIRPLIEPCLKVYGDDMNDQTWFRHSPLAQVATITCPVSTFWTTADVLVPMNQIGDRWVQPFDARQFPDGLTMDPAKLTTSKEGRLRLTDVLPEQAYEVFVVSMPDGAVKRSVSQAADTRKVIELPVSAKKQWSITILDEGPPEPQVDHLLYNLHWTRDGFLKQTVTGADCTGPTDGDEAGTADGSLRRQGVAAHAAEASRPARQRKGRRAPRPADLRGGLCRERPDLRRVVRQAAGGAPGAAAGDREAVDNEEMRFRNRGTRILVLGNSRSPPWAGAALCLDT